MRKNIIDTILFITLITIFTGCMTTPSPSPSPKEVKQKNEAKVLYAALTNDIRQLEKYYKLEDHDVNSPILHEPLLAHLLLPENLEPFQYLLSIGADPTVALKHHLKENNRWFIDRRY